MDVQAARAGENYGFTLFNGDVGVALFVEIGELAAQSLLNIVDASLDVLPAIGGGIFEVKHHPGRAGIEHFYDEVGVVGRAGHLIALVGAPSRQLDFPRAGGGLRRRQIIRLVAGERIAEGEVANAEKELLARSEFFVKRGEKFEEAGGQFGGGLFAALRASVDGNYARFKVAHSPGRRRGGSGLSAHEGPFLLFSVFNMQNTRSSMESFYMCGRRAAIGCSM